MKRAPADEGSGPIVRVQEIMTTPAKTVREDETVERAAALMLENKVGGMPVVDADDKLVGIITESAFVGQERNVPFSTFKHPSVFGKWIGKKGLEEIHEEARNLFARDIMVSPAVTVRADDSVEEAVTKLVTHEVGRLPVVDANDRVVGIVTRHDLLRVMVQGDRNA